MRIIRKKGVIKGMNQSGREPEPIHRRLMVEIWFLSIGPISNQLGCVGLEAAHSRVGHKSHPSSQIWSFLIVEYCSSLGVELVLNDVKLT